ncbi:hypothetical protein G7054_g6251 [Neopestalotiopsis clavispora]|nr:hypothetical protein G7054_g6251 [Neopestalotiopsis clavispora]
MAVRFQQDFTKALEEPRGPIGQEWRKELADNLGGDESEAAAQELYAAIAGLSGQQEIERTAGEWLNRCIQGVCERALKSFEEKVGDWIGAQVSSDHWAGVYHDEWENRNTDNLAQSENNQQFYDEVAKLKTTNKTLKDEIAVHKTTIHEQQEEMESIREEHRQELRQLEQDHAVKEKDHKQALENVENQLKQKANELKTKEAELTSLNTDNNESLAAFDRVKQDVLKAQEERDEIKAQLDAVLEHNSELEPDLKKEQELHAKAKQELETQRSKYEKLQEDLGAAKTRIAAFEKRGRRSESPETGSSGTRSNLLDELSGLGGDSDEESPSSSPISSHAGSNTEQLRNDYVMPILRQVAHHRDAKNFKRFDDLKDAIDAEAHLLETLGALISNYGQNYLESRGQEVFDFPFADLQQWLEETERAAATIGPKSTVADIIKTIQSSFEGENARLSGLKAQKKEQIDKQMQDLQDLVFKLKGEQSQLTEKLEKLQEEYNQAQGQDADKAEELNKQISNLKDLNAKLIKDQAESAKELEKLRESLGQAQGQDADKTKQIQNLLQDIARFNAQQKLSDEELMKLHASRAEAENQNNDLAKKLKDQQEGGKKEREDAEKKKQRITVLEEEVANLKKEHQKAEDEMKSLQDLHDSVEKGYADEISELTDKLFKSESKQISDLQKQRAVLEERLKDAMEELQKLKDDYKLLKHKAERLAETEERSKQQIDGLKKDNKEQAKRLQNLEAQLADLTAKATTLDKDFEVLKKKYDDLQIQHENLKAKDMSQADQITKLEKELEEAGNRRKAMETELQELKGKRDKFSSDSDVKDKRIAELEELIAQLERDALDAAHVVRRLQHESSQHQEARRVENTKHSKLQDEWDQSADLLRKEVSELKGKQDETEAKFAAWKARNQKLEAENEASEGKIDELVQELINAKVELEHVKEALQRRQHTTEEQEAMLDANKAQLEALQLEIKELKDFNRQYRFTPVTYDIMRKQKCEEIEKLKAKIVNLESDIETMNWSITEGRSERAKKAKELEKCEEKIARYQKGVETLQRTIQNLMEKNSKLEKDSETSVDDEERLQEAKDQLKNTQEELERLKKAQEELDQLKANETQLREELSKSQEQLKQQEQQQEQRKQNEDRIRELERMNEECTKERERLTELQKQKPDPAPDADAAEVSRLAQEMMQDARTRVAQAEARLETATQLARELQEQVDNQQPGDPDMAARVEIGRLLLRYYRAMQAALETYRTEKVRMIDEGTPLNPGFLEDMDNQLRADRREIEDRLDKARIQPPIPATATPEPDVALLERELERYGGIINEVNAGTTLANEAFEIGTIFDLSPHAADAERLFDERRTGQTQAETQADPSPGTALTEPRRKGGAEALAEACCCCFPCTPCDWLIWVLVAAIAFFVFAFVSQMRQKAQWSEANALSRSLYVIDKNYNNPTTWWQIAIFIALNIKAFYLK